MGERTPAPCEHGAGPCSPVLVTLWHSTEQSEISPLLCAFITPVISSPRTLREEPDADGICILHCCFPISHSDTPTLRLKLREPSCQNLPCGTPGQQPGKQTPSATSKQRFHTAGPEVDAQDIGRTGDIITAHGKESEFTASGITWSSRWSRFT